MKNRITSLEIKNFKSIKHLKMDCKRINVLIGEPNVGKSNILEAISLYLSEVADLQKSFLQDYIRYEQLNNLFYDQNRKNIITVESNIGSAYFRFHMNSINQYDITLLPPKNTETKVFYENMLRQGQPIRTMKNYFQNHIRTSQITNQFPVKPFYSSVVEGKSMDDTGTDVTLQYNTPVKRYIFKLLLEHKNPFSMFLRPPYGDNLYTILESNPEIYDDTTQFFTKYRLDLLMDTVSNKLDVQKRIGNKVYKIPFSLAADTLQRIIFHLAAIKTNHDSILLFEEPEAHAFPKYISLLAEEIIESKENQFFIVTHSPYVLTPFIERCPKEEISFFVCRYDDYETKIHLWDDKEISELMVHGIDYFYNLPIFEK